MSESEIYDVQVIEAIKVGSSFVYVIPNPKEWRKAEEIVNHKVRIDGIVYQIMAIDAPATVYHPCGQPISVRLSFPLPGELNDPRVSLDEKIRAGCVSRDPIYLTKEEMEVLRDETPQVKSFTWADARAVAIILRDGFLMIVRGLERVFDLRAKK